MQRGYRGTIARPSETAAMERVRREVRLGPGFSRDRFEDAFERFVRMYNVAPSTVLCAPDVLARFCALYDASEEAAHRWHRSVYRGVPIEAAVLPAGTLAFEGEVDEERMGDW